MRIETSHGALAAALLPGLQAVSMGACEAGAADAARRSRVDTGAMRAGWHAEPLPHGGARMSGGTDHDVFNEFGTSRMRAQPMARPSMDVARAAIR